MSLLDFVKDFAHSPSNCIERIKTGARSLSENEMAFNHTMMKVGLIFAVFAPFALIPAVQLPVAACISLFVVISLATSGSSAAYFSWKEGHDPVKEVKEMSS